jgi:hypothetical protein
LDEYEWSASHGSSRVKNGRLVLRTDTDYLVWTCPQCQLDIAGGTGLRLIGVSCDLNGPRPSEQMAILAFSLHCFKCHFQDHFKLPFDHFGRFDDRGKWVPPSVGLRTW